MMSSLKQPSSPSLEIYKASHGYLFFPLSCAIKLHLFLTGTLDFIEMAAFVSLIFLGLLGPTLSVPISYNQTASYFGTPGQNLTYDYIVGALRPLTLLPRLH